MVKKVNSRVLRSEPLRRPIVHRAEFGGSSEHRRERGRGKSYGPFKNSHDDPFPCGLFFNIMA
ncbi:hypothetical protein STSP2_02101 [Anaerohalosphaera lusitana]|uniref:Uncharacterized protein n=1 Tax=Anaerohalosphaera lusitana TaxID=1936003 RepID=A0A1U9NMG1_9BACT|nr:hypothetical protein [Anaerohalosphaera lusitana]AQT68924.1 hypothetical protein STSP2_02101 [Anaerohalosphaera lusitana]